MGSAALAALVGLAACSSSDGDDSTSENGTASFVLSTLVFGPVDTTSYVNVLDSLDPQTVDLGEAREFAGLADVWVHDGSVFVAEFDARTITRFSIENRSLIKNGEVSFLDYGLTDFGFWLNTFVSSSKAYFLDRAGQYVVWDPSAMAIVGTLPLPELPHRDDKTPFPGYSDRAALLRDGLLYQPIYWADEAFFEFTADSRIVVIDTERDEVVDVLEAPCPGLDFATRDESDNLYFSSWIFAPGGAALLDQPATCVVKVPVATNDVEKVFELAELTSGREGGVMRYLGDGRALVSVLHHDHASSNDVAEVTYGPNWRFWSLDVVTGDAAETEDIDWNAGAAYSASAGGKELMLVPAGDYTDTTVFEVASGSAPRKLFDTGGWSLRVFELP
jgi:hypothetical protein